MAAQPGPGESPQLTHLDREGAARMVDVGAKDATRRLARAEATVRMAPATAAAVRDGDAPKGDVVGTARLAGIQAAKRTDELIPLAHTVPLAHVDVEIELESETRLVDFNSEPVDLGIRHGLGRYPGLESTWLMAPALIVVASPALIAQGPSVRTAEDCLAYPLLQEPQRSDWRLWFQAQGIETDTAAAGPAFADDDLLIGAAVAGQGLALVRELYAADEIDAGRLVQPLDTRWPARFAYYLVGRPSSFRSRAVRAFRDWLVDTARQDDVRTEPRSHQPA